MKSDLVIGVISDTHGTVLPCVHEVFKGVDRILHAGDIDRPHVISELEMIAPVTAVRGNMDRNEWFYDLPSHAVIRLGSLNALLIHDRDDLYSDEFATSNIDPANISIIISGHTHKREWKPFSGSIPGFQPEFSCFLLNPGSAYSPRGGGRPSVALLKISGLSIEQHFAEL